MKKIILFCALFSLNTLGGSGGIAGGGSTGPKPSSSWDNIRKNDKYKLANTYVFVGVPRTVFDVCVDGDKLITNKEYPVYKYERITRDRDRKILIGHKKYSFPISYTAYREVCNGRDKNCKKVPYTVNQELDREITVSEFVRSVGSHENRREIYEEAFTKPYSIPDCKN